MYQVGWTAVQKPEMNRLLLVLPLFSETCFSHDLLYEMNVFVSVCILRVLCLCDILLGTGTASPFFKLGWFLGISNMKLSYSSTWLVLKVNDYLSFECLKKNYSSCYFLFCFAFCFLLCFLKFYYKATKIALP